MESLKLCFTSFSFFKQTIYFLFLLLHFTFFCFVFFLQLDFSLLFLLDCLAFIFEHFCIFFDFGFSFFYFLDFYCKCGFLLFYFFLLCLVFLQFWKHNTTSELISNRMLL